MKPRTSLIGALDSIVCPKSIRQLDYEGELALFINKKGKDIPIDNALDYVGGYFIMNDISSRDIQFADTQLTRAKSFDTFGPCGPWITTPDEIPNPNNLKIITKVNGKIRQNSNTKNLVLNIQKLISQISKTMTLEPCDVISTGTPSGTALSLCDKGTDVFLKDGDVVEVRIEKLGKIKNKISFVD
jgi:2-keto-4-pentenoate hydratase/2-oxohepta-3-ene-1,7-dioic acid hydratase in catechol pathway